MKVLAVGNEKGGTGKSAIATQMAFYAAEKGARVLLVDLDPQATCTFNFVDAVPDEALTSLHLFGATVPLSRSPCKTHAAAHWRELTGYDIVIIDTPPTRGKLCRAALRAADAIVTPFEPKAESLRGIAGLIDTIGAVRQEYNPRLRYLGIVANRVPVDNIGAAISATWRAGRHVVVTGVYV